MSPPEQERARRAEMGAASHLRSARVWVDRYHTWENEVNVQRAMCGYERAATRALRARGVAA